MKVYEFYLNDTSKGISIENLSNMFYGMEVVSRKVDHGIGSPVYAISRNPSTNWVQLLVDDNVTTDSINTIDTEILKLCDDTIFVVTTNEIDNIAPKEKLRSR